MTIDPIHFKAVHDALIEHQRILMAAWGKVMNPDNGKKPGAGYVDGLHSRTKANAAAIEAIADQMSKPQ